MVLIDLNRKNIEVISESYSSAFPHCVVDVRRSARAVVNHVFSPKGCGHSFHILEAVKKRMLEKKVVCGEERSDEEIVSIGEYGGFRFTSRDTQIKLNGDATKVTIEFGENTTVDEFLSAIIGKNTSEFVLDILRNNQRLEAALLIPENWDSPGYFTEIYISGIGKVCPTRKMKLFE